MPSIYVSHPEVVIDPAVEVPRWGLSATGAARARAFAARRILPAGVPIFSSTERKATELAAILAEATGGTVETADAFGENDRSATGFLAGAQFEDMVDRFFGDPDNGPDGWESARDAQRRIVNAVTGALRRAGTDSAIFCGHGGVGTLLKCHVGGRAISRDEDQRVVASKGGGNCFVFDIEPRRLHGDWVAIEDFGGLPA